MTSLTGSDIGASTLLSRRLSVLPTLLGVGSVILLLVTGVLARVTEQGTWGQSLLWVAAACVATTILSGHPVGIYVGMAVFTIAALGGDEPLTGGALAIAAVGMLLVHELARASLDARRPARFGPGLWGRYAGRTFLVALVVAGSALLGADARDLSLPTWLVPVGLGVSAIPLLTRRLMTGPSSNPDPNGPLIGPGPVRVALGVLIAATAISGSILGATARSEIENVRPTDREPTTQSTSTTIPEEPLAPLDDVAVIERGVAILLFFITMLVVGFLYIALKRPEVTYDLDDLDMGLDESSLGLAGPGQADLDDEQIEIDERELVRLLDELALDIGAEEDPGRAIRFAYANIERRLADMDVVRPESETEQEFLTRAMPSLGPQAGAMVELTGLFERARFGHEPMTEDMRTQALDAVDALRNATTQPEPEPEPAESESEPAPSTDEQASSSNGDHE